MKQLLIALLFILTIPATAAAHAVPLESSPASSAALSSIPGRVEIRFSERIDVGASLITVTGPSGAVVSNRIADFVDGDSYRIAVPIEGDGEGAYVVAWSVVSSDDGHFTKGAFPFAVGEGVVIDASLSSDTQIVQIATLPEVLGMTVELFGHGVLWAVIALFAFAIRPLFVRGRFLGERPLVEFAYGILSLLGATLAISGAAFQVYYKMKDLAVLHGSALLDALPLYLSTVAGEATLFRMSSALAFIVAVVIFRRAIVRSNRFTWQEGVLVAILALFAFFRAKVSHATANHFFPDFSVGVNFIHLIEKDIWAGLLGILCIALIVPRTRELFTAMVGRVFSMLTLNLAAVALTASYIVWLHLKDFENLFSTQWGSVFMELLLIALLLVCVRTYHSAAHVFRPKLFASWLPFTLAAELALALMVIYASSVVIITSPPPEELPTPIYSDRSEGAFLTLEKYAYQDDAMRIRVEDASGTTLPAATLRADTGSTLELDLKQLFPGSYVFPASLIAADRAYTMELHVPQTGAYDAVAVFDIPAGAFDLDGHAMGKRTFDIFSLVLSLIALCGLGVAVVLYRLSKSVQDASIRVPRGYVDLSAIAGLVVAGLLSAALISVFQSSAAQNPYKSLCESEGNMWHIMLPTKAGIPLSRTPREGCMWGMGAYQYMFPERAEYEYYASLPSAAVSIDFASEPVAGENVEFTVNVRNPDGSPATLFVDMEKLVHVVIVSEDQTVFAHVHPDDERALTEEERRTSSFRLAYTFPKSGKYLLSVDYANGITLESSQHPAEVRGRSQQELAPKQYSSPARVGDFDVSLSYSQPFAGEVSTLIYTITKNGQSAELEPYLSAAMHIAVVKNDFAAFAHTHGEVHPPGSVLPPVMVREGKIVHSMVAMSTPPKFAYPIDAHVIFPEPGLYTVWGQFKSEGEVYAVPFSVRVEE